MADSIKVTGAPSSYKANLTYGSGSPKRRASVEAALELIHAHASSGCGLAYFDDHISKLGEYADAIDAACAKSGNS